VTICTNASDPVLQRAGHRASIVAADWRRATSASGVAHVLAALIGAAGSAPAGRARFTGHYNTAAEIARFGAALREVSIPR